MLTIKVPNFGPKKVQFCTQVPNFTLITRCKGKVPNSKSWIVSTAHGLHCSHVDPVGWGGWPEQMSENYPRWTTWKETPIVLKWLQNGTFWAKTAISATRGRVNRQFWPHKGHFGVISFLLGAFSDWFLHLEYSPHMCSTVIHHLFHFASHLGSLEETCLAW